MGSSSNGVSGANECNDRIFSALQRRLDQDALELRSLYNEIREALHNIVRVKEQRRAVRKDVKATTKALEKIRDQGARTELKLTKRSDLSDIFLFSRGPRDGRAYLAVRQSAHDAVGEIKEHDASRTSRKFPSRHQGNEVY